MKKNKKEEIKEELKNVEKVKKEKKEKKIKKVKEKDPNKVTFGEKLSLKFRQRWMTSRIITILLIACLIMACVCLNLWLREQDILPEIDTSQNKLYSMSDESKEVISKIDQDVKVWFYGFDDNSTYFNLIKQYNEVNPKITYDKLTTDTNYALVNEYGLEEGYMEIIFVSGDTKILVDSQDLYDYDYTTYQTIDVAEQKFTNTILALVTENKPKVYVVDGHGEFVPETSLQVLNTYLEQEAFEVETINIANVGSIPEDCAVLAIIGTGEDLFDNEAQAVKDYINKGGNLFVARDVVADSYKFPNFDSILAMYGAKIEEGFVIEYDDANAFSTENGIYPVAFNPTISKEAEITEPIATSGGHMLLYYAGKINTVSDEELNSLRVTKTNLLSSSGKSIYLNDLSQDVDINAFIQNAMPEVCEISALFTKEVDVNSTNENGEEVSETKESKLVLCASAVFLSDTAISEIQSNYPLVLIYNNKDFALNSMNYLAEKETYLTLRKNITPAAYSLTEKQTVKILTLVTVIPIVIFLLGLGVNIYRKRRK